MRGTDGAALTYAELAVASDRIAQDLRSQFHVKKGDRVGLYVNRSVDMVVAMIGIMKAGAAFVPIDPIYPQERVRYMLNQAEARLVISEPPLTTNLEQESTHIVLLADIMRSVALSDGARSARLEDYDAEQSAYVIFTSGTTGQPKGVLVPHRAVSAFLEGMIDRPGLSATDRFLTNASISFDMTIYEIFLPLAVGAEAIITSRAVAGDGEQLVKALNEFAITSMIATPATWRLILAAGWQGAPGFKAVCGGEAFPRDLANQLLRRCGSVWNIYGPTETTVICLVEEVTAGDDPVLLGFPTRDTELHIVGDDGSLVAPGAIGELLIGGPQVSHGYLQAPELNAAKFIPNRFATSEHARILYRSGDLVRRRDDGNLEYHGRIDSQVKIRGYRIELGEIHAALARWDEVLFCHLAVKEDQPGDKRIIAYVILKPGVPSLHVSAVRASLRQFLPEYMIPHHFMVMTAFPMTANGKVDNAALPRGSSRRADVDESYQPPQSPLATKLTQVFAEVLQFDYLGVDDDLFSLGLNSLLATTAVAQLRAASIPITVALVYDSLTVAKMCAALQSQALPIADAKTQEKKTSGASEQLERDVAIIGMAGRFPGADDIAKFWQMLLGGEEGIKRFRRDELSPALSQTVIDNPNYVPARGIVSGAVHFDAKFFGVTPVEAAMIDPQQRLFLEECWHALEDGGYAPKRINGNVGVYAGMHRSTYLAEMQRLNPEAIDRYGDFNTMIATEKDYIASRVAHRLDLRGPAVSVHTACSTSAVAIASAVTALRAGQCDMALAGGASITIPQNAGHLYAEGGIQSHDGHCRPFASDATGTVFSDGVAVILLKRLGDAVRDGDRIYAVIRGVAVNNDGSRKSSFMAPSISGQQACIEAAIADAGLHPHAISHVEAHGTGTAIGDPIETIALRQALTVEDLVADVKISSIKSNFGHMVATAGVASVIKTALALANKVLPPSLHASTLNPQCGFDDRFRVNTSLTPWDAPQGLFAGVSSFGVGGTNAHLILTTHTPPIAEDDLSARGRGDLASEASVLVPVSARTRSALEATTERVTEALTKLMPGLQRYQGAHTMQTGREAWNERSFIIAAADAESSNAIRFKAAAHTAAVTAPPTLWMFPGQGAQYVGMAQALYHHEPTFRTALDTHLDYLNVKHGMDLKPLLLDPLTAANPERLHDTRYAQPAILVVSMAMAHFWRRLGLKPSGVIGHSIGEFAAAECAGIMTADTAIDLVVVRGRVSADQPPGSMLAVRRAAGELTLPPGISLAAVNAPEQTVLSGPSALIADLSQELAAMGLTLAALKTSHAFHSEMMQPVAAALAEALERVTLHEPKVPFYSTVTGALMAGNTARSSTYWATQVIAPVNFAKTLDTVRTEYKSFLEVGPRAVLSGLVKQNQLEGSAVPSASPSGNPALDHQQFLKAAGVLWQHGHAINWQALGPVSGRQKISMPGYAFDRNRHWVLPNDC